MRAQFTLAHMDALLSTSEHGKLTQPQADAMNKALYAMRNEREHGPAGLTPEEVDAVWAMGNGFDSAQTEATAAIVQGAFKKFAAFWCENIRGPYKLGVTHASGGQAEITVRIIARDPGSPFCGLINFDGEGEPD